MSPRYYIHTEQLTNGCTNLSQGSNLVYVLGFRGGIQCIRKTVPVGTVIPTTHTYYDEILDHTDQRWNLFLGGWTILYLMENLRFPSPVLKKDTF